MKLNLDFDESAELGFTPRLKRATESDLTLERLRRILGGHEELDAAPPASPISPRPLGRGQVML